jgi:diguanylate cyclase (GGDEF)-like protein
VGDAVLQHVANILTEECREVDVPARLGGDEFAILFNSLDDGDEAMKPARRILERVGENFAVSGHTLSVGVSIGIAIAPVHGNTMETLTRNADSALYEAKNSGRNAIWLFAPDGTPKGAVES